MKIWTTTIMHTDPKVFEQGMENYYRTTVGATNEHVILDHHWPIDRWNTRHKILEIAEKYGCTVMTPYKNMGGHGGFTWLFNQLPIGDDDLIIGYDPDGNPLKQGWDKAMIEVLQDDPKMAYLSLMHEHIIKNHNWTIELVGKHRVGFPQRVDMFNITAWKASFLKKVGGHKANSRFYGFVETAMAQELWKNKMRHGYLFDYTETLCQVEPPESYIKWKGAHAMGIFPGNYCDFIDTLKL